MEELSGRIAVVPGAAQGIGRAIAQGLARHGACLAVCNIDADGAAQTAKVIEAAGGTAVALALDVKDAQACFRVAEEVRNRLGPAGILVKNARIIRRTPLEAESFGQDWQAVMAVNATGVMQCTRAFADKLRETRGAVVNLASIMGGNYPGGGITLGPAITFGYIAARHMAGGND